ncbi:hypothetical protein BDF22DRAFT_653801 [Syncephalis plumigaleata]|nr:hypothetical protein BDF22DRAFT_653801 [Syncephalis plumigaleata]
MNTFDTRLAIFILALLLYSRSSLFICLSISLDQHQHEVLCIIAIAVAVVAVTSLVAVDASPVLDRRAPQFGNMFKGLIVSFCLYNSVSNTLLNSASNIIQ